MIIQCEQRTRTWFLNRTGRVTASEVSAALNFVSKGSKERGDKRMVEGADRANYRASLICEILTGEPDMDGFNSKAMQWGEANEAAARSAYELRHDVLVDVIGFGIHDSINRLGASPDALVGDLGGLEIKCLKTKNHMDILKSEIVPGEYLPQVYTNMAVFNRDWWDFGIFDPRLPKELRWWDKRIYREDAKIAEIESGVAQFLEEVDMEIEFLQRKYGPFEIGKPEPVAPSSEGWLTDDDFEAAINGEIYDQM